ncbi:HAD family hydrolase, partial [Duganella callida]
MSQVSTVSLPGRGFDAFLFDMDGTILTSIKSAERVWGIWAAAHGLDVQKFLPTIHGKRSEDTVRAQNLPGIDPVVEAQRITLAEINDVDGIDAITGVADFLASLPAGRWAIVTSAPRRLAAARIA